MKIEHFAINVPEPEKMAEWYVKHLSMRIVRQDKEPPFTTFLADKSGKVMIEIYKNPPDKVPDYDIQNPLIMHIAFVSSEPARDLARLQRAGAKLVSEEFPGQNDHIVMMRDPWGVPIQLCKRSAPMLGK